MLCTYEKYSNNHYILIYEIKRKGIIENMDTKIILASKSPRRKELMDMLNLKYEVIVSDAEETLQENVTIEEQSKRLSYIKAKKVFDETTGNRIVIGSDTMVIKNGKIYGKPKDEEDAFKILKELSGTKHQVITGLAVLVERQGKYEEYLDYDITEVYFKNITDTEIRNWIATGKAMDKAGAYAVQGEFSVFIEKINGNYWAVMGLPIHKVYDILKTINKKVN